VIWFEDEVALWARRAALAGGAAALALFAALVWREGIPRSFDPKQWEVLSQLTVLLLVGFGYVFAWRWELAGAIAMLCGSVVLGVLASIAYEPRLALAGCLVFFVPGMLFALHWQRKHGPWALATLLAGLLALLFMGGVASARVYDRYFGPTHPSSDVQLAEVDLVQWAWSGSVTTDSFVVKARAASGIEALDLVVRSEDVSKAPVEVAGQREGSTDVFRFELTGLRPDTSYSYQARAGEHLDRGRPGTVRTFPAGPSSFTVAIGSCLRTGSNGQVFDRIREQNPTLFLLTGDFHYEDISANDPDLMRRAMDRNLTSPAQETLYLGTPIAYVWDDHDFGGNDSSAVTGARPASMQVYDEYVPHYPLGSMGPVGIAQAFTIGRVRFILLDTRSARVPDKMPDGPDKTMLGSAQKAWLKRELLDADGKYPLIAIVTSVPWIAEEHDGADNWGGFATERREIANFIADNGIDGVTMIAGDAHMVAIDDGTNSDYSDSGLAPIPVLQAAALDRPGMTKGGPYSEGMYPGGGQFGLMSVEDDGGNSIRVTWTGMRWDGSTLVSYSFQSPVPR
jgi:hypothetical protein